LSFFQERTRGASSSPSPAKTTESVTLRLDKDILDKLKKEAKEKQISLNVLMGQIAQQHLEWHSHSVKAGFITVRRGKIMKILEKITEKDIVEIAEYVAKKESKGFVMMLRNEYNITSALDVIETWIKISGYSYRHEIRGSEHSYIIQHEMGKKWSLYLRELYRFIFEDFGLPRVDFDVSDDMLSFRVDIGAIFLR
jgi:predicted DNA-binding ribbon-helix-helix protein